MHVDNILAGKRIDDIKEERLATEETRRREKEQRLKERGSLPTIQEERFEVGS